MTPKTTPKDFFLWAGAMVALYIGVFSFVGLLFDYLNYVYPDTALQNYYVNPYQGSISYEMASLIVLAPVLLILMRVIRRAMQKDPSRREIWVRRWALFLTLFAAGATIVVDLIVLINTFLQGEELSVRFLLKILVVLLVAAAGFMHFTADLWGYWEQKPHYANYVSWAVALLIVLTILSGFLIIGSPQSQRTYRLDEQRAGDLQSIQWQIVNYWQRKQKLPGNLAALNDPLAGYTAPVDPVTGQPYEYIPGEGLSFQLCATFGAISQSQSMTVMAEPVGLGGGGASKTDNWQHGAGRACFERTIDPQLYPPVKQ
jgi:hypothetical protein